MLDLLGLIKYYLSMYKIFRLLHSNSWGIGGAFWELREKRTGPHPPFLTMMEIWECHRPLPPSIWRLTGTSICSYVIQSFGRCFCLPSCASPCGSGTRFSPVSRTSLGMWQSRCASVWTGTCWKWTLAPAPKVVCWWRRCACACCFEVSRLSFL